MTAGPCSSPAAARAGTTIRALRYYEQQGLLQPRRARNGYREYGESAVAQVGNIRLLLSLGFTAHDVHAFAPCLDQDFGGVVCPASARVVARRLADVEEKIEALNVVRERLVQALPRA